MGKQNNTTQTQTQQQGEQDVQDQDKLAATGAIDNAERSDETAGDQGGEQSDGAGGTDSEGSEGAGEAAENQEAAALAALAAVGQGSQESGASQSISDLLKNAGVEDADLQINDAPETPAAPAQQDNKSVADAPNDTPVAAPAVRVKPVTLNPIPVKVDVKTQQDNLKLTIIQANLDEYTKNMGPGQVVTATVGKVQQTALWRTIEQVLKLEGPEFLKGFELLLAWVAQNRTYALNDKNVYRFFGELSLSDVDRKNFNRLLNLLVATCDPATRLLGLQQVDLTATLEGFRNGAIQQRVAEFYSI